VASRDSAEATAALRRLRQWQIHRAAVGPLIEHAWRYRNNMTAADALYVGLAEVLGAHLLTADNKLVGAPTFPEGVQSSPAGCRELSVAARPQVKSVRPHRAGLERAV
jgi:hypothetical protein